MSKRKSKDAFKAKTRPPWWIVANPIAWALWGTDYLIWLATIVGPVKALLKIRGVQSICAPGDDFVHHQKAYSQPIKTAFEFTETGYALLERAWTTFSEKKAMGTRTFLGDYKPEGAKFALKMFGETKWITYGQAGEISRAFGSGLRALGMEPLTSPSANYETVTAPSTLLIFEDTCAEWSMAAHGAFSQSICVATSYATLGIDSVANAINETSATTIVCNSKSVPKVATLVKQCASLKNIIYTSYMMEPEAEAPALVAGLKVISFDDVVKLGKEEVTDPTPPTGDTMALLMYTSGSTGKPKGVMLNHSALCSAVSSVSVHMNNDIVAGDTYLAYLPAAHILEFTAQLCMLSFGLEVGYADPRTISSKGAVRKRPDGTINTKPEYPYPPGAIQEFKPSVMAAVPKIWDILKKGVEDGVGQMSPAKQFLFQVAFAARAHALKWGRDTPFLKLIFKKVTTTVGGRLKCALSGGGPVSSEVQTFIRTVFCCPLIQGYALTETCSIGTIQPMNDSRDGVVGKPLAGVQMKLVDCGDEVLDSEKRPYKPTDVSHKGEACNGRGEVCIRGPPVALGYYKQSDKTAEAFVDGWFHTGDIGLWTPDGSLKLVDRLKNLVKLKGGEYIALESMEKEYSNSVYVNSLNGGVMVYGTGDMDKPCALVQVLMPKLQDWAKTTAKAAEYAEMSPDDLCKDADAIKEVLRTMEECHKVGKLGGNEKLATVCLISGAGDPSELTATSMWGPGTGLTASNKLDRKAIESALSPQLVKLAAAGCR